MAVTRSNLASWRSLRYILCDRPRNFRGLNRPQMGLQGFVDSCDNGWESMPRFYRALGFLVGILRLISYCRKEIVWAGQISLALTG